MKTKLCILIFLLAAAFARAQTNNLTALLQTGLFEEQANRNLDAAIANYQTLATQFDKDRQLAAAAIFRLGECYRAQGKTNEAAAQYQRVLRDFADEKILVTLSQQNLTGLGMGAESPASTARQQQKELLARQITLAGQNLADMQKLFEIGKATQVEVRAAESEVLRLRQQLAALDADKVELLDLNVPTTSEEDQEIVRIQQMIQNSPDLINAHSEGGAFTPLAKAAANGWLKVATYLLDHGAEVNVGAPLIAAATAGNRAMVELLLSRGANANSVERGRTPLAIASDKNYPSVVEVLLANKADVNSPSGETPLSRAAAMGNEKIVKMLLAAGANPDVEDGRGLTPLASAAAGSPEIVKLLLDAKADPNGGKLDAPLLVAINKKDAVSVELLLQAGANPNTKEAVTWDVFYNGSTHWGQGHPSETPLFLAVSTKQIPMVQLLLKFKADPNDSQTDGNSMLFSALSDTNILETLLAAGAKVDALGIGVNPNNVKLTPLGVAAWQNNAAALEVLLKHGANPNVHDPVRNWTPLHCAAIVVADRKIFELLLAYKAERNVRDDSGQTPLDILKEKTKADNLTTDSAGKVLAGDLADLLRHHGALDKLPDWDRITVSRPSANFSHTVFQKGTNDWNQFSLLELIGEMGEGNIGGNLAFADLARIVVVRPSTNNATAKRFEINLLNATNGVDFTKDIPLEFGDAVEIPEREHTLAESPIYLPKDQFMTIFNYLRNKAGQAKLIVKGGQTISLPLQFYFNSIGDVLLNRPAQTALTSSSDLTQVKVIRPSSKTGKAQEWILDCSHLSRETPDGRFNPNGGVQDLLLHDGDLIEVPEKP